MLTDAIARESMTGWFAVVTLVVLLGCQPWRQFAPTGSLAGWLGLVATALVSAGLLFWADEAGLWYALAAVHFWWIAKSYYVADNHYYLMGYWCLSIALALNLPIEDGVEALAESARLLIGVCFLLATVSKLLNKRYKDSSFFVYTLVIDGRFLPVARYLAGVDPALRHAHLAAIRRVGSGDAQHASAPIPAGLRRTAVWLTWWTVAIEATIALVFLLPAPGFADVRVAALLVFAVTTYVVVPVSPFGQILLVMAAALPQPPIQRAFLLGFAVVLPLLAHISVAVRGAIVARAAQDSQARRPAAASI